MKALMGMMPGRSPTEASPEKPEKGDKDEKADKADKVASPPQKSKGSSPNLPAVASAGRLAEQANGHHRSDSNSTLSSMEEVGVLKSEITRLADQNASLARQLETSAKASKKGENQRPKNGASQETIRKLAAENKRLSEQKAALERRTALGKQPMGADEPWRLREENRALKDERQKLQAEMDKVTKVATVVGGRLAKLVMDARRNASGNTQLVEELKRYNRRLEIENDRLYNIIQSLQKAGAGVEVDRRLGAVLGSDSGSVGTSDGSVDRHDHAQHSAELLRQLDQQQSRMAEDMKTLSSHAASLQHLSGAKLDGGGVPMPRTPSIYEEDQLPPSTMPRHKHAHSVDDLEILRDSAQRLERATSLRGQLETEASLRQQLEDLQASSASLQEDNAALQAVIQRLEVELDDLRSGLPSPGQDGIIGHSRSREDGDELEERTRTAQTMLQHALDDRDAIAADLDKVQGLYQAGMEELQQELAAKEEAQAQLRQQAGLVDQLQAEVSALGAQKEQLLADLAQLADAASMSLDIRAQRNELVEQAAAQSTELRLLQSQVANLKEGKASSSELQSQLAAAQRGRDSAQAAAAGLRQELAALQQEAGSMQQEHAASLASLQTQTEERLQREAGAKAQAQAELRSLASQAEEERRREAAAMAQARAELVSLRSYAEEQQREHAEQDHRLHATHSNLLEQHDALNDERAELEATLQALREQAAAVEADHLERQGSMSQLQRQASELQEANSSMSFEHRTLADRHASLTDENAELNAHLAELQAQLAMHRSEEADERNKLTSRLSDVESSAHNQRLEYQSVHARVTGRCAELEGALAEAQHRLDEQGRALESRDTLVSDAAARAESLQAQLRQEQAKLAQLQADRAARIAALEAELVQLKQEHGDLCTAAALRESEASQELTGMRRQHSELQSQASSLQQQLAGQQESTAAEHQLAQAKATLARLQAEFQALAGSNEELKADNAQLVQAYEDSQERHKQDTAAHQARNVHIAQVMLRLEEQHSNLASEREQLAQELTSIQELVMAQDAGSLDDEARQAFADLQARHGHLSAQVAAIVEAAEVEGVESVVPEIRRLRGDLMRLSAEAAEFPALREGRQTLYDLNTRLARQLADLQHRSPGADGSATPPSPLNRPSTDKGSHAKMKEALQALEKSTRVADMFNGGREASHPPLTPESRSAEPDNSIPRRTSGMSSPRNSQDPSSSTEAIPKLESKPSGSKLKFWRKSGLRKQASQEMSLPPAAPPPQQAPPSQPVIPESPPQPPQGNLSPSVHDVPALSWASGSPVLTQMAEQQVFNTYDRFVDQDNVVGFMHAMGFTHFQGPEADMFACFSGALQATDPARIPPEAGLYDRELTCATHQLLQHWQDVCRRSA